MSTQSAVLEKPTFINGLDVGAAVATIAAVKADKSLARFQFRARNTWVNGGENRSVIQDFYGAGIEDTSRKIPFTFINGEPPVLLGNNEGANPVEFLLHALAGCVTTTFVLHAMAHQRVTRPGHQRLDDEAVETAGDDGKAAFRRGEIAFDDRGNAVYSWKDDLLVQDSEDAEKARRRALDHPGLSMMDDEPHANAPIRNNHKGTRIGYNPYESGMLKKE